MPCRSTVALAIAALTAAQPASACRINRPIVFEDVRHADVILVGRVSDYRIVLDEADRERVLANPKLPPDVRRLYEGPDAPLSRHALLDVGVDEVLVGTAPPRVTVRWYNSTFGPPQTLPQGPFLIALQRGESEIPGFREPDAAPPVGEPQPLTILQAPCSAPFLFGSGSDQARAVRRILAASPR